MGAFTYAAQWLLTTCAKDSRWELVNFCKRHSAHLESMHDHDQITAAYRAATGGMHGQA